MREKSFINPKDHDNFTMADDAIMLQAVQTALENPFPQPGEMVNGKVIHKSKNKCLLDICNGQAVGVISGRETHDSADTFKTLVEGDLIDAVVVEDENDEGFFVLSLRKAAQNSAWDRFSEAFDKNSIFEVKATEANKGGLLMEIDSIKAFLPVSQLAPLHYPRVNEANSSEILRRLQALIGIKFTVKIIAFDRENGKLILSERAAQFEARSERLGDLKIGDVVHGKISGIVKFGLFVAFDGLEGLVHISEIAWGHVRNPADHGKLEDPVDVMIIGVEGEKISLSIKRMQRDPWVEAAKKYTEGTKIKGKINRITTFGAFVNLEKDINGLIHLSEISHEKVDDIDKFLKVGQEIEAEVINVDLKDHRIGLSMKKLLAQDEAMTDEMRAAKAELDAAEAQEGMEGKEGMEGMEGKEGKEGKGGETAPESPKAEEAPAEEVKEESKEEVKEEVKEESPVTEDLSSVDGVTKKSAEHLKEAGFDSLEKLKAASLEDLEKVEGIGPKTAEKIHAAVK